MKAMKNILLTLLTVLGSTSYSIGQCNPGEVELELTIHTDQYGYEGYWELVPAGNNCGTGTIISGGNNAVGCNGGGAKSVQSGGYGNNQVITVPAQCLTQGNTYTIQYRDDWGDGGFNFDVVINGYSIAHFEGKTASDGFTFVAEEPLQYNVEMHKIDKPYGYTQPGSKDIEVHVFSRGKDTINSLKVMYQIDNNTPVSSTLSGLSITNFTEDHLVIPTPWNAQNNGVYSLKVWVDQINGNADMDNSNDTLIRQVEIGPGIPNIVDSYLAGLNKVTEIGTYMDYLNKPTDIDFHPVLSRKELWVVNKRTESQGGSTVIFSDAGTSSQSRVQKVDGNAWHFMSLPTGIAFGENENFATSPGVYDANHDGGAPFTGPALWSSDPAIYAQPSGGNGSHLDMLHESPYCQGIAHEKDNVYWVFDGYNDDIVRYDFAEDHGPGNSDHADGIIWRYSQVNVDKDPYNKVVSHLVYDKATDWLYVVDYGNQRVIRIDATTGSKGGAPSFGPHEAVAEYKQIVGYTWETVVDSGLVEPAGIDIIENRMLVSDYATGDIIVYDLTSIPAVEMGRIHTAAQGIMGIKVGPEGAIWYVDYDANTVNRIDLSAIGLEERNALAVEMYPNPSNGVLNIIGDDIEGASLNMYSSTGQLVFSRVLNSNETTLSVEHLPAGVYQVQLKSENDKAVKLVKLLISDK